MFYDYSTRLQKAKYIGNESIMEKMKQFSQNNDKQDKNYLFCLLNYY